ncbi:MAG: hypothetical protein ACKVZH_07465 [Blastocatellia bacterium]
MELRNTNNFRQSIPPSLRLDGLHAWRQSEDAVILPIEYDFSELNRSSFNTDAAIIPIQWPLPNLEIPSDQPTRKQKLALLKQKVESARQRAAKAVQAQRQANPIPDSPVQTLYSPKNFISVAVLVLLASVLVTVVFAWACFR